MQITSDEAMKLVKNDNVIFHVIGLGPKTDELKKMVNDMHLRGKVIYHGALPAKKAAPYFKACDVSYISLKPDGYVGKTIPNKLMMSMAFGKPILGVLEGDAKDIINESKCGYTCNNNPEDIAKTINKMSRLKEEELKRLGNNAKSYYFDHFSTDKVSKEISTFLQK